LNVEEYGGKVDCAWVGRMEVIDIERRVVPDNCLDSELLPETLKYCVKPKPKPSIIATINHDGAASDKKSS